MRGMIQDLVFVITVRFRTVEDACPYKLSAKTSRPTAPAVRQATKITHCLSSACTNDNNALFLLVVGKADGGGEMHPFSKVLIKLFQKFASLAAELLSTTAVVEIPLPP